MLRFACLGALLLLLPLSLNASAQPSTTSAGEIDRVTVYRGQALVTRVVELGGETGLRELVVSPLPAQVEPGSLYAESADGLEVRSVRYRSRPVEEDVRQEVRELDAKIQDLGDEATALQRRQQLLREATAYLGKLENFTAATATTELTHGVLDADTLKTLSDYIINQREQIAIRELQTARELREVQQQLSLVQRQRQELASKSTRTAREAVVLINVTRPGQPLRLSYLVGGATWSPSYIVRAAEQAPAQGDRQVRLEYYASIQQTSGEDWDGVAMTLSTATPSLAAAAPELVPLEIQLSRAQPQAVTAPQSKQGLGLNDRLVQLENAREEAVQQRQRTNFYAQQPESGFDAPAAGVGGAFMPGRIGEREQVQTINRLAGEVQLLELSVDRPDEAQPEASEAEVTVSYDLPQRTSLPSRRDQQMVRIASAELPASLYRVAVPVLTGKVYREASLANRSGQVLLAGPVASYLDGQFVGHTALPTVAMGERFTVGLGIDPALRSRRELTDREEEVQGGNRVVTFTYRLALDSFAEQPVTVRLADRIPVAEDGQSVGVTLLETGEPMNDTAEPDQGLLRWTLDVPAGASGDDAATLDYSFRMAYDRQMSVTGMNVR